MCPPPPQHQRSREDSGTFDGTLFTPETRAVKDLSPSRSRPLTAPTSKSTRRVISHSPMEKVLARSFVGL